MRLMRLGPVGQERPVVADTDGAHFDLRPITADIDPAFFADDGLGRTRQALADGLLSPIDVSGLRRGAPVARPGVVLCIGMNYAAHAAEAGAEPPLHPVMFYKAPNTVVGPDDDVMIPRGSQKTDWEVELAVVIGRRARYLSSPEEALAHVAGYTISNDVSERDFQFDISGGQWSKGKSCETFNPLGPWLVTPDELTDPTSLRMRLQINGEPRQDSSTADMIFDVATLVYRLSQVTVLEPGDVINTGTPQGVAAGGRYPYLRAGDVVTLDVDGLGGQRQSVVQA